MTSCPSHKCEGKE